jgi:hypothetical protein
LHLIERVLSLRIRGWDVRGLLSVDPQLERHVRMWTLAGILEGLDASDIGLEVVFLTVELLDEDSAELATGLNIEPFALEGLAG